VQIYETVNILVRKHRAGELLIGAIAITVIQLTWFAMLCIQGEGDLNQHSTSELSALYEKMFFYTEHAISAAHPLS
jgi:hypothetical protein